MLQKNIIPPPKKWKVYIRKLIKGAVSIPINVKAHNTDQAKMATQMMLRKRNRMELGRDYEIVTIKQIK